MLNIIIIGAPGSGKGTQGKNLAADAGYKSHVNSTGLIHLSTGDLLRGEMALGTELGKTITETMNSGEYVSDAFVSQLVMNKTHELGGYRADGFIFDGFPRTVPQCEFLYRLLGMFQAEINVVLSLKIDSKTLIERLLERGKTSGRAEDQDRKTIVKRLKIFSEETTPILEFFKASVIDIDATGTPEDVYTRITKALTGSAK